MASTSEALLDAKRKDFEGLPPKARARLLDMLCLSGVESPGWWRGVLAGSGDPARKDPAGI
ncbi:hypothetical protein C1876_06580 [Eggerthella sinensis]|jgi:hypothetical protein|uniref:Uncharacterized protein n=1 Tax=Eggerthella sinensis TaxID=242230 RepID=A0A3N0IYY6_9ACTN|nr:hypothetical protein [Eggerthella sinensis]RDB69431.1 hypothetical protein C1876_06580 [Eggerthella sinensis]RNM41936.1 hypothetical protein DMP09_07420 [Eggerthella sinensis]